MPRLCFPQPGAQDCASWGFFVGEAVGDVLMRQSSRPVGGPGVSGPVVELHRAALEQLREELREAAGKIPGFSPAVPELVSVNGAGNFAGGGPEGETI